MNSIDLLSQLENFSHSTVYFGPQGFRLYASAKELETAQIGFSVNEQGHALTHMAQDGWQESWVVFAQDTEMGDPYFVDTTSEQLRVLTGFKGDNGWEVDVVATSLSNFLACLLALHQLGHQDEACFVPDDNTIVDAMTLNQLKSELIRLSGGEGFWTLFINCYVDWLSDDY